MCEKKKLNAHLKAVEETLCKRACILDKVKLEEEKARYQAKVEKRAKRKCDVQYWLEKPQKNDLDYELNNLKSLDLNDSDLESSYLSSDEINDIN